MRHEQCVRLPQLLLVTHKQCIRFPQLLLVNLFRPDVIFASDWAFIRSGQNHLARHSERGKKTRQTEEEVGRQHQGMDRPGVRQALEGSGEQGKTEKTGCKIICGASTTVVVKGLMMMVMMMGVKPTLHDAFDGAILSCG